MRLTRNNSIKAVVALTTSLIFSSNVYSSDEQPQLDEVAEKFMLILGMIEAEYDCLIKVVSIKELTNDQFDAQYFATFRADGVQCREASYDLIELGKSRGIVFFREESTRPRDVPHKEPILDLIYEIDPPIEE